MIAKNGTFDEAFPDIGDFTIQLIEAGQGTGVWEGDKRRVYRKSIPPGVYVDCSNAFCCNGGVSIGSSLRNMVHTRATGHESTEYFQGYQGLPKRRRRYRSCMNRFKVKITLAYKDNDQCGHSPLPPRLAPQTESVSDNRPLDISGLAWRQTLSSVAFR